MHAGWASIQDGAIREMMLGFDKSVTKSSPKYCKRVPERIEIIFVLHRCPRLTIPYRRTPSLGQPSLEVEVMVHEPAG